MDQGQSGNDSNSFPWQIRATYGDSHEPIVDYIVVAEFDIDTGSTVRHQYPTAIPSCSADWLAENMLPEGVHNRSEDWTYMFLNRDCSRVDQRLSGIVSQHSADANSTDSFLYGISLVRNKKDDSVRRGAIVKAMALFSRYSFIEAFRGPLIMALDQYYHAPCLGTVRDFFSSLRTNIPLAVIPRPTATEQLLMRRGVVAAQAAVNHAMEAYQPDAWTYSTKILMKFSQSDTSTSSPTPGSGEQPETLEYRVPLSIPLYRTAEEVGDTDLFLALRLLGADIMRVFHAVLTKRRVLFVGYNHAACDIAQVLFSCVSLVTPPLVHNHILRRVFPYANLSDLSFLEQDGYIAGVTNPMFQSRYEWWDLLCVLNLPAQSCRVFSPAERRAEDGVQPIAASAPALSPRAKPSTAGSDPAGAGSGSGGVGAEEAPKGQGELPQPPHAALTATQTAIAARLYQEELVAHEATDAKFIGGVLQAVAVAGRELGEHWIKQQFFDYTNSIVLQAMDSLYSANRLVSKKLRRYSFRSNVGHNSIQKSYRLSERTRRMFAANAHRARVLGDYMYDRAGGKAPDAKTTASLSGAGDSTGSVETSRRDAVEGIEEEMTENGENEKFAEEFAVGTDEKEQLPVYEGSISSATAAVRTPPTTTPPGPIPTSPASSNTAAGYDREHVYNITQMYILRLMFEANLHPLLEMQTIFSYLFAHCTGSEEECQVLLGMMPVSMGGLGVIASGALHANPAVRLFAVRICDALSLHDSTRPAVAALNGYYQAAIQVQRAAMEDGKYLWLHVSMSLGDFLMWNCVFVL